MLIGSALGLLAGVASTVLVHARIRPGHRHRDGGRDSQRDRVAGDPAFRTSVGHDGGRVPPGAGAGLVRCARRYPGGIRWLTKRPTKRLPKTATSRTREPRRSCRTSTPANRRCRSFRTSTTTRKPSDRATGTAPAQPEVQKAEPERLRRMRRPSGLSDRGARRAAGHRARPLPIPEVVEVGRW